MTGTKGSRLPSTRARRSGASQILLIVALIIIIVGAATVTILRFVGGGKNNDVATTTIRFHCMNCEHEWTPDPAQDAKIWSDMFPAGGMPCPACGAPTGLRMTQCPGCGKLFVSEQAKAGLRMRTENGPPPDSADVICPYCKLNLAEHARKELDKR